MVPCNLKIKGTPQLYAYFCVRRYVLDVSSMFEFPPNLFLVIYNKLVCGEQAAGVRGPSLDPLLFFPTDQTN